MNPLVLRRMRWWDVEHVLALERALFPDDAWSAETFWSELAQDDSRHYVVAADPAGNDLQGYAGLLVGGSTGDVQTIAVAPSYQGRGLGSRLLRALLVEATRRGCADVLLEVRADNAPAQALYRRSGFEQIAIRRDYYAASEERVDGVVMRLQVVGDRTVTV